MGMSALFGQKPETSSNYIDFNIHLRRNIHLIINYVQ